MANSMQDYLSWVAAGQPGSQNWWSDAAAQAAEAANIPFYHPDYTAGLWTSKTTPWGENVLYNQQGQAVSWKNPAWESWVRNWMAQNGGTAQPIGGPGQAAAGAAPAPRMAEYAAPAAPPVQAPSYSRFGGPPQQPSVNTVAAPAGGSSLIGAARSRQALMRRLNTAWDF